MQWRFIATISKGLGEMYRMRERWKLCTYTAGFWVATVWPCTSSEVDGKGNGWKMLRIVYECLVIFRRQGWGSKHQGHAVYYNTSSEQEAKASIVYSKVWQLPNQNNSFVFLFVLIFNLKSVVQNSRNTAVRHISIISLFLSLFSVLIKLSAQPVAPLT